MEKWLKCGRDRDNCFVCFFSQMHRSATINDLIWTNTKSPATIQLIIMMHSFDNYKSNIVEVQREREKWFVVSFLTKYRYSPNHICMSSFNSDCGWEKKKGCRRREVELSELWLSSQSQGYCIKGNKWYARISSIVVCNAQLYGAGVTLTIQCSMNSMIQQ